MRYLITLLFFCLLLNAPMFGQGDTLSRSFVHNDSLRSYLLYVPAAYDGSEEWPLVINCHQFGWSPSDYMAFTGMNAVADTGRVGGHYLKNFSARLTGTSMPAPKSGTSLTGTC